MDEKHQILEQENFVLKTQVRDQSEEIARLKEQVGLLQAQFQKVRSNHA